MLKLAIVLALGGFAVAAPDFALAQSNPQGTADINRALIARDQLREREVVYEDNRREISANRRSDERQERADRLSAMANNGQCRQAVVIARREGDNEMARSLVRHCGLPARPD